jgi:hypothetical protein
MPGSLLEHVCVKIENTVSPIVHIFVKIKVTWHCVSGRTAMPDSAANFYASIEYNTLSPLPLSLST